MTGHTNNGHTDADCRRQWLVTIILAVGVATAVNLITLAALLDALLSEDPGLSENATQILTGAFSGAFGVLGSVVGYRTGYTRGQNGTTPTPTPTSPP